MITILLAAVKRGSGDRRQVVAIWVGVVAALSLSVSAAIVLTASLAALPAAGQSILSGLLGLLAVVLVTRMIFTMRRTARTMNAELSQKVAVGAGNGTAALMLTAFAAVARESLEATLFLWTASRQNGDAMGSIIGAVIGIALGLSLAWLLYRRSLQLNLGKFFTYTAVFLTVVIAGILSYSVGELQSAGWLPGRNWIAWDVSATIDASSWWMAIVTAVTGIAVRMTVLQVAVWVLYLVIVLWVYFRVPIAAPSDRGPSRLDGFAARITDHQRSVTAAVIVVPLAVATAVATMLPKQISTESTVTVAEGSCGADAVIDGAGVHTFNVRNKSGRSGEITLEDPAGDILGEIETLAPKTTVPMRTTVPAGRFRFHCAMAGSAASYSSFIPVSGAPGIRPPAPKPPVTEADLAGPAAALRADVLRRLDDLRSATLTLNNAIASGDTIAAQSAWRTAIAVWQQSSASYRAFGDLGDAIGGPPWPYPHGVDDPAFRGLRRVEYGLWHGQSPAQLAPVGTALIVDIDALTTAVRTHDPDVALDPKDIPLRAHEVLEEAERHLTNGFSDLGAGSEYLETDAMIANTRVVLDCLGGLLRSRDPQLLAQSRTQLDRLESVLKSNAQRPAGDWVSRNDITVAQRLAINAGLSSTLELLAKIPGELEPPLARTAEGK
ncbi:putative iron permease FTR1 [Gordonia neofelifaecis NRRL B-59395]|uniref:Putative iron permease FTR1 n=1 Tax=Gordonia neofelifaecis NRRL B-59395 TaxID=644548 RepID=F1YGU9_9ACTN|nr:putative iron permease FTR1 [Gordonia neofelifaecis NRRL B-59395]